MSKVWQAFDKKMGRTVCVKFLDKVKTAKFEERFKAQGMKKPSEGEICIALNHENCVKTYEHGVTTDGEPYLVMEWIDGRGLNFLVETKNTQLNGNRINYMKQLCDALEYLHTQKYIHRDLCPRNVMVNGEGVVKLIDFGLTVPYTPIFCKPGNRTGTVDYLAPEIIKRGNTDHRIDLFALGITAFEMFAGVLPWEHMASSEETLKRRLNTPPKNIKTIRPDLDKELAEIIMKSIEVEREKRFATAAGFKAALGNLEKQDY